MSIDDKDDDKARETPPSDQQVIEQTDQPPRVRARRLSTAIRAGDPSKYGSGAATWSCRH